MAGRVIWKGTIHKTPGDILGVVEVCVRKQVFRA